MAEFTLVAAAICLGAGFAAGLLAGLLGIGGGIVAVPVLIELYAAHGLPADARALLAVGTAQAMIVPTGLAALLAHARAGNVDAVLLRRWATPVFTAAVIGVAFAALSGGKALTGVFAFVAVLLGLKMLLGDRAALAPRLPDGPLGFVPPAAVGFLAASLGIGAGTLGVPAMSLFRTPLRAAIGVGSALNVVAAAPALAGFVWLGWHDPPLPGRCLGHVDLPAAALLALGAVTATPLGARLSATAPLPLLRGLFALALAVVAVRLASSLVH